MLRNQYRWPVFKRVSFDNTIVVDLENALASNSHN